MNSEYKLNDEVWTDEYGWGIISHISHDGYLPVDVTFENIEKSYKYVRFYNYDGTDEVIFSKQELREIKLNELGILDI